MLVYVINKNDKPLMPCSPAKARRLLKAKKAIVSKRTPFTIKLLYGSSGYKQEVTLGIDAGSKVIGLSAVTEKKEYFIFGRRTNGGFDVRDLSGNKIKNGNVNIKYLRLISKRSSILNERVAIPPQS